MRRNRSDNRDHLTTPLFNDELKRVEVWCGSLKVGDIPPKSAQIPDEEPVRHSA
jgi:hypothetical protein